MRNRANPALWIGAVLVMFLIVIGIVGPYIAPYDLDFQEKLKNVEVNGKTVILAPPLPPSEEHWLGTDKWGYDLLTKLLYGAPYTIFVTMAAAVARLLIGTLIGLYIGMQDKPQSWWLSIENAWGYLPIFIPTYFLLVGVSINSDLSVARLVTLFIFLVAVLGAPSVASSIRQKTEQIKETQYVLAATSLGAGREQIIFRHILPQLKEQLILIAVTEMVAIMTLMGLLGMFDLFVGGTKRTFDPVINYSITQEWAGLLGSYRGFLYGNNSWIFMIPLAAFIFAISSFSLLAKGLRDRFQETYQRKPFI
ncbi:ABC transporter permease subunit [Brevibacillus ruminantium]|uniref:ABC transporter permease subunit n=1 Tax=Brevibacillus ruminantium TaxID=2950604 RepID=A0ABY4WE67_9BACL|nr:ABC transporter permease subunit [Brevibacillus ruminantium]USG64232.1 ABC transporter permease subunit [Brevibacillus ruminantium]